MSNTKQSPSRPRQKTVSFKSLEKQVKKLNTYSTYVVNEETNEVIKYYEEFGEAKIDELLMELKEHIDYDQQREEENRFFINDQKVYECIHYLCCKHFTHFKDEIGTQFETNIQAMVFMHDKGYLSLLHNEIFNPAEVFKVYDRFNERAELGLKQLELDDESKEKLTNLQYANKLIKKDKIIPEA